MDKFKECLHIRNRHVSLGNKSLKVLLCTVNYFATLSCFFNNSFMDVPNQNFQIMFTLCFVCELLHYETFYEHKQPPCTFYKLKLYT